MDRSPKSPAAAWDALLRPDVELAPAFWERLERAMRAARLTFGGRLNCPFLRPFFLDRADEARVTVVAESVARLGERVVAAALERADLLSALCLSAEEERLVRIDPGYATASTASRLDAFLLPDALKFAEYNAESPAGLGYSETLARLFEELEITRRFSGAFTIRVHALMDAVLDALTASYREWGGRAAPPTVAIVDWREVPTWSEFHILRDHFERQGVPAIVSDPRDLTFDGRTLAALGRPIDLVYRRVLVSDLVARPGECEALLDAYARRAVCVANTLRCKIPHKKAFFAVLTDERFHDLLSPPERELVAAHVPWTRVLTERETTRNGALIDLVDHVRTHRAEFVLKPNDEYGGSGVTLGWETDDRGWDAALERALAEPERAWIAQERIPVRREQFPLVETPHRVVWRDMLVDFAPYLFRGRVGGYLTRLSSSGLANVTSGGGQVPVFVVESTPTER